MSMSSTESAYFDAALAIAKSATRAELLASMRSFAEAEGFQYLQVWIADDEDAEGAILLVAELGHQVGSVANDLYRLLPDQGLAGACWAAQADRQLEASDPDQLARCAAPEFVTLENLYTIVAVPVTASMSRGVALVASRGRPQAASEEFRKALASVACLALDRYAELQTLGAGEAAQFVVSAVSNQTDEHDIMVEALARFIRVVPYEWAVFVRWQGERSQLPALCAQPSERRGSPRRHTPLLDDILRSGTPFRAYRIGVPGQFASNRMSSSSDDLANLLDGAPDSVLTGGHCMAASVRLQEQDADTDGRPTSPSTLGIVIFGRSGVQPGFTSADSQVAMSVLRTLAAVLTCVRRSRTGMAMLDSAASVLAEPSLEGIRTKIVNHLAERLGASGVSFVPAADLAAHKSSGDFDRSTAAQVLAGMELAQSVEVEEQFLSSGQGKVEVLGAVVRMERLLGALRLEVAEVIEPKSPEASLVMLLADHLALAETEQQFFDVALDSYLAGRSLAAALALCDAGVVNLLGPVEQLAQAGVRNEVEASGEIAQLRGKSISELVEMRSRVGLVAQMVGLQDLGAIAFLEELNLDQLLAFATAVVPGQEVRWVVAPANTVMLRSSAPSAPELLRLIVTVLSVAAAEIPGPPIELHLDLGGHDVDGVFGLSARWLPTDGYLASDTAVVAGIALGRVAAQMGADLDRYVDGDGWRVIGLSRTPT
jgi:hypothetical protein